MARSTFSTDKWYAGRLTNVIRRPIENLVVNDEFAALRLEFEMFLIAEDSHKLFSRAELACRDIVVGSLVKSSKDAGVAAYAISLSVSKPEDPTSWEKVAKRKPWIRVKFAPSSNESTGRNPFADIQKFNPKGYQVIEAPFRMTDEWVGVKVASEIFKVSGKTIHRRLDKAINLGFENVVRRTPRGHRRIKISLLYNLWDQLNEDIGR